MQHPFTTERNSQPYRGIVRKHGFCLNTVAHVLQFVSREKVCQEPQDSMRSCFAAHLIVRFLFDFALVGMGVLGIIVEPIMLSEDQGSY